MCKVKVSIVRKKTWLVLLLHLFWWILYEFPLLWMLSEKKFENNFQKLFLNREIGLIRTVIFVIIISRVQRKLKLLHTQHYQIFWLFESHVIIKIATYGTLTFEPSKKTIRGNALCVQVCQRFEGLCWFWNLCLNFLREKC